MLHSPELRTRIGTAARETILNRMTLSHQAQQLAKVYAEAMAMGLGEQDTAAVLEVLKKTIIAPSKTTERDRK